MDEKSKRPPIVKRQYSRRGCNECKRRKIKCNEVHPTCGNCARLKKVCVFPDPNQRNKPRRPRIKPIENLSSLESLEDSPAIDTFTSQENASKDSMPSEIDSLLFDNVFDDANTLVHGLADFETLIAGSNTSRSAVPSGPLAELKPFHSNIILNEDPKRNVYFDEKELEEYLRTTSAESNLRLEESWNALASPKSPDEQSEEINNEPLIAKIIEIYRLSSKEQQYLRSIAAGQSLLYFFPFASRIENNEFMHVFLEYSLVFKYLAYALMSVSASCQFTITKDREHDYNQKKLTTVCMRTIVAAFTDIQNDESSLWHIEGLILTVLVLTMLFSDMTIVDVAAAPVSWISHLREARSLLIKYQTLKCKSKLRRPDSLGIVIAKSFFFCYYWNANIALPVDAVGVDDMEALRTITGDVDAMWRDNEHISALIKLGLYVPASTESSGFNTYSSLTPQVQKIVYSILDTICSLNRDFAQGIPGQASPQAITSIMALINEAFKQQVVPGNIVENNYVIPLDNPTHPSFSDVLKKIELPKCAYGIDTDLPNEPCYSWCDITLRSQVYFLYLKILTSRGLLYLPRIHPLIKSLINEMMSLMFFVKPKSDIYYCGTRATLESRYFYLSKCLFDHRAIMLQFPFRLCAELTDSETDLEKLGLFFEGMLILGCGNCSVTLTKIRDKMERLKRKSNSGKDTDFNYETNIIGIY